MRPLMTILLTIPILIVINATGFISKPPCWYVNVSIGVCMAMIADAWLRDFFK
jgi:hypothetical protein